jgi:hypothetical protein
LFQDRGAWPDDVDASFVYAAGKLGRLAKETIARMDCVDFEFPGYLAAAGKPRTAANIKVEGLKRGDSVRVVLAWISSNSTYPDQVVDVKV